MTRIFVFAKVADWDDRLEALADMAEPERWKYIHAPSQSPLPVLDNYVKYTFARAFDQQKIVEGDRVACFNTGLLTAGQEEIFGVFTISDNYDRTQPISFSNKKWWLKSWARSGDRALTDFMEFPSLVEYWNDPKDLIFDPKLQVQLNLDHIIKDNLNRFPEELGGKVNLNGVPTDLNEDTEDEAEIESAEGVIDAPAIPLFAPPNEKRGNSSAAWPQKSVLWILAISLMLFAPATARAQSGSGYGWYPGFLASDASCWVPPGGITAFCATANDACLSIADFYAAPAAPLYDYVFPTNIGFLSDIGVWNSGLSCAAAYLGNPGVGGLYAIFPPGSNGDSNSFSGISPAGPGGVQPLPQIGGGNSCDADDDNQSNNPIPSNDPTNPNCTGDNFVGDPINVPSGNLAYHKTDYKTNGQNPLGFTRYYNSRGAYTGTLGVNWRSSYDRYIWLFSSTSVALQRADGQMLVFTLVSSAWTPETDVDYTLTQSGSTWTLRDPDDTIESYTTTTSGYASGYQAQLNTIVSRNGYTKTLAYNATGQLTSVTDSYIRTLTLAYNASGTLSTITTPDGTTITYGYATVSGGQNLTTVTFPTSPPTTLTYVYADTMLPHALTGVTDEKGDVYLTWTYDAYGRALTDQVGTGPNANLTTIAYNDSDGSRTVTNAFGVIDTYSYVSLQNAQKVTGISRAATLTTAAATRTFSYDSNGYLASATDWSGNLTTYLNDIHGDPLTINEAVGTPVARTTTIVYDAACVHLPDTVTTVGLTTSFTYDPSCDVLTHTDTDTTSQTVPYSTNGQMRTSTYTWSNFLLASARTPNGNVTKYSYSASGALTRVLNPLHQAMNITSYTGGGYPLTIVDPNNVTTTLTYNARLWRLTSTVSAMGQPSFTTTWGYDPAGNLTSLTLPDNSKLTYGYDTAHRLISITDLFNNNITYTLDALGDVTLTNVLNPKGTVTRTHFGAFDALGRVLQDIGGEGQTTTYTYDNNGNALTITDPDSNLTQQSFDALNRVSTVTYPSPNGLATMAYDQHNRLLTVTDPNGNVTAYVYDGFGDLIGQTSPDSGPTVYYYNPDRDLMQKVDATGAITNDTYDALDRVLTTTYPADAAENVAYTYDQAGHGFGIGHLTSLTDAVGSLARTYDERGNMLRESRTSGANTLKTVYTYDPASRIATIGYPSAAIVAYTRDIMGRINRVSAKAAGVSTYSPVASSIAYKPFGPVNTLTFGNGIADARAFDLDYRMTRIADTGTAAVQKLAYVYDPANNLLNIQDKVNAANSQAFKYDTLNRLKQANSATGGYGKLLWTYDGVGNRLTQTANGVMTTYVYTPGSNRLASITTGTTTQTVGTTAAGNIDSFSPAMNTITALSYNQANRLATVTAGTATAATYTYDAFGRRLIKAPLGVFPILYQFDQGGNLLEDGYGSSAGPVDYIYLGTQPIATLTPGTGAFAYLHTDHLGTPQLATGSTQAAVWNAGGYQPFGTTGTITGSLPQNIRLPGQYSDSETGFYHNSFRDYVPGWGRYLESDPIGLAGGVNTFGYAGQSPLVNVDPWGLECITWGHGDRHVDDPAAAQQEIMDNLPGSGNIAGSFWGMTPNYTYRAYPLPNGTLHIGTYYYK